MSDDAPRRLTPRELESQVRREMAEIEREHPPRSLEAGGSAPSGRCRVCTDPAAKTRVNTMLSYGMRPAEIVENLTDINARRRKNSQIGYWSVRDHRNNHFNVQEMTRASQLRVLERRAAEEGKSLAEGIGTILTLRGYLEIIANKGFAKLVDPETDVGYTVGLDALRELEQLEAGDRDQAERAAIRRDLALIQQAIVESLSEEQMRAVSHRLDVLRGVINEDDDTDDAPVDVEVVDDDDDEYNDEVADFVMDKDEDDELGG